MFANLLHLFGRRPSHENYDLAFVKDVRVNPPKESRSRRSELWLIAGWVLILLKCAVIWWAITRYHVPIHPMWLVGPTILFGLLATALYVWRD